MKLILVGILLLIASIMDIKQREISLRLIIVFFILGICCCIYDKSAYLEILSGIGIGIIVLICGFISREGIGYGDGLIFIVTGIYLGGRNNLVLLLYSLLFSALFGLLVFIKRRNKKDSFPMVPFILIAFLLIKIGI